MKKILHCLCLSAMCSTTAFAQGVWTQKLNFGGTGRYMPAAFSIGTKAYVGTGFSQSGQTADFWEWNQSTDTWTQKANFPEGNNAQCVGFTLGLKGYVIAGTAGNGHLWQYDPTTNFWTQKATFGGVGQYNAVTFTIGSKAYVGAGGANYNNADFWEYDGTLDAWTQRANFGGGIREMAAGFSIGPKGYIGTGRDAGNNYHNDFWEFDPATNVWTQKTNFPGAARDYATGLSIGNKGYLGTGGSNASDWWQYNPVTDSWTAMASIPNGGTTTVVSFTIGNKGYLACGQDQTGYSKALWEFDPQDTAMSLLHGQAFLDANANCVMDAGDAPLQNWFVQAQNTVQTSDVWYGNTDAAGNYDVWTPSGSYSVSLIPKPYWTQVCPSAAATYSETVGTQDTVNNLNFGAAISSYCPDLALGIGSALYRPCRINNYYVQYWNNGTTTAINPLLKINFDPRVTPLSSTIPWTSVSGNSYFWQIDSVQPGQFVSFNLTDSISCSAQVGDTLFSSAQWLNVPNDCDPHNNEVFDHHIVTASHDPNAKEAYTTSHPTYTRQANILATDTINYVIHFQNTGTDTAFTVVVYDTLDSHLNVPSVISGVSSHPYTFELLSSGVLKWTFNNILLPDSTTNELASNGFVKFQILQKAGNLPGTTIFNTAAIVFDVNAPVITNTVALTIAAPEAVQNPGEVNNNIKISPNPNNGVFVIASDATESTVEIYNVMGEQIFTTILNSQTSTIDLSNQANGIYFVTVKTAKGTSTQKIIVNH